MFGRTNIRPVKNGLYLLIPQKFFCGLWNLPTIHYSMWHWNDSLFYTTQFSVLPVDTTTPFVVYGIFQLHIILCDTDMTHFSTQLNFLSYLLMPQCFLWSVESSNYAQLHVILTWITFLHNSIFCLVTCWYHNSFSSLWTLPTMHLTPCSTDRINSVSYLNTTTLFVAYAVMESCSYSLYRTPCDRQWDTNTIYYVSYLYCSSSPCSMESSSCENQEKNWNTLIEMVL